MALKTDREKCAHLLRRFGLGASEAELDYYLQDGFDGAIDRLLDYESVQEAIDLDPSELANNNGQVNVPGLITWWGFKLITTRRPLLEKMTLFWHDHFATSAAKVNQAPLMYQQNEVLRKHATGDFRTLLLEVSQDPAMLFWLDNQFNVRGKPNENFAREVMELFTLGIGHYTEKDIQESARAFTGWSIGRLNRQAEGIPKATFLYRPALHDSGVKEFLGSKGNFSGEDVIGLLCGQPQTAKYLTGKLWEWFAYPDPEPALVDRLATRFRDSGLDIKGLLRDIMRSSEFYSAKAERKVYKNPIDFTVATIRQLGIGEATANAARSGQGQNLRGRLLPATAMATSASAMGMRLLYPPDVSGWEGGAAWISSATMVERIKWSDTLFGTVTPSPGSRRLAIRFPAFGLFAKDPTPAGVVDTLLSLYDAPLAASKKPELVKAAEMASDGRVTQANANATGGAVSRLIFGAPEFQFA
ncbi:MAG: DUF1800 domain-containing protein [Fimbriimonadaceae bacterium]|nr:DUF1800 domain-containing protein [Fimbriimonadaceae bacterium]